MPAIKKSGTVTLATFRRHDHFPASDFRRAAPGGILGDLRLFGLPQTAVDERKTPKNRASAPVQTRAPVPAVMTSIEASNSALAVTFWPANQCLKS